MAAGKEIRGKIKSVENTKKITKAMEMVAASKMRKAQDRMRAARPFSEKIRHVAANLGKANPEYVHPFMELNHAKAAKRKRSPSVTKVWASWVVQVSRLCRKRHNSVTRLTSTS